MRSEQIVTRDVKSRSVTRDVNQTPCKSVKSPHWFTLLTRPSNPYHTIISTCVRQLHAAWGVTVYRIVLPFARGCRVGV